MENVFMYFVMIGAGLALGVSIVTIPSILIFNRFKSMSGRR